MPIYEYRCEECDLVFPRLQRVGAGSEGVTCPHCGSEKVTRELSTFASTGSEGRPSASSSSHACGGYS